MYSRLKPSLYTVKTMLIPIFASLCAVFFCISTKFVEKRFDDSVELWRFVH